MSAKVISSGAWEWESRKVFSGHSGRLSGTIVSVFGVTTPCWRAAAAVMVLLVEPGSNMSAMARFLRASGLLAAIRLGSKVGMLAMARTSPVRGLITTTEPALALCWRTARYRACSVTYWRCWSMVRTRSVPGSAGSRERRPWGMARPCGSRSSWILPAWPRSSPS